MTPTASTVREEFLACVDAVGAFISTDAVVAAWDQPSALEEWAVSGLAGHLARAVLLVPEVLDDPVDASMPRATTVEYFVRLLPAESLDVNSDMAVSIRARGVESAGAGPSDLVARYEVAAAAVVTAVRSEPADREIGARGLRLTLDDYLVTRMIEACVHMDDLGASVGVPAPVLPDAVTDRVLATLAAIAARRHGATAVLRGLARSERAPASISAF